MTYPKPLSQKSIDKLFASWDTHTVDVLHKYYAAFSNLYGSIQLKDAWKILKQFEPKIHKKQFLEFSSIVRREDVPYCIFEIDELYCDEPRRAEERFIINKELILDGYYKLTRVYRLHALQCNKPYYNKPDLLEVAAHPRYDKDLIPFIANMKFTDGEQKGKRFCEAVFLTKYEEVDIKFYKSKAKKQKLLEKASIPFSEKLIRELQISVEFDDNPIAFMSRYFDDIGYVFESKKQMEKFFSIVTEYMNKSHLWCNGGYSPSELHRIMGGGLPKAISLGPGIKNAIADGQIDYNEFLKKFKEMGIDVIN